MTFIERGQIDVVDGAFVVDKNGTCTHIPVGSVASLMLESGLGFRTGLPLSRRVVLLSLCDLVALVRAPLMMMHQLRLSNRSLQPVLFGIFTTHSSLEIGPP